eukprot:scaffold3434_cov252-Chaetoceros_neogracile.AAC.2
MIAQNSHFLRSLKQCLTSRCYSSTSQVLASKPSKDLRLEVSNNYNKRRATYNNAVGQLRKQYANEVAKQRLTDEKALAEKKADETRKRLERQRVKNLRSVQNAMRHEETRKNRAEEFEKEVQISQVNRNERLARFDKARRLVLQELEEESVHWLSTPEAVDAALDGDANVQQLWSRAGGFAGAPMPAEDADFWRYESHTWDMSRTYQSAREKVMEEIEELAYYDSNLDPKFWDEDKIQFQNELEQKAKLRALVREEGRKSLLLKQRRMMQDTYADKNSVGLDNMPPIPSPMPAPSLNVLADYDAMEMEGAKILEEDPSKFFVFDSNAKGEDGQSKGKPIRLRDPVRDSSESGTPFPELIGRLPKTDTRTEREKKRQEREERMWAAAQQEVASGVDFAADDELMPTDDPVDYDKLGNFGDEVDQAWEEGLDPQTDADLLNTPRDQRFNDDDVEWMIESIEKKISSLEEIMKLELANNTSSVEKNELENALGSKTVKTIKVDERGREYSSYEVFNGEEEAMSIIDTLSAEQIQAIEDLGSEESTTEEEVKSALSKVPGLSDEQVQSLVNLEMSLKSQNKAT